MGNSSGLSPKAKKISILESEATKQQAATLKML